MLNKRKIISLSMCALVLCTGIKVNALEFLSTDNTALLGELYKANENKVFINDIEVERKMITQHFVKRGTPPEYIVIHDTDNRDSMADAYSTQRYFNTTEREASAHYAVQDTAIVHMVEDTDTAWHCGDKRNPNIKNSNSIGIEISVHPESDFNVAMDNAIELTKYLMKKYDIPPEKVVRHHDASGKICPRMMLEDDPTLWTKFKASVGDKEAQAELDKEKVNSPERLITKDIDLQDEPSWIYTPIAELLAGQQVDFIKQEGTWVNIKADNKEGWVPDIYIESKVKGEKKKLKGVTTLSRVADDTSQSLDVIDKGDVVNVYNIKDGWAHIKYNNKFGYVRDNMLE